MNRPRLSPAHMPLGLAILLAQVHAFETIDPIAMYDWLLPRLDELRLAFYQADEPAEFFPVWLRAQFLAREVTP